ncbi:MAG: family 20 glycosylhydrolase, partial [Caulobacteraceae bacterium]
MTEADGAPELALMPAPRRAEAGAGELGLEGPFEIAWRRGRSAFLERAAARFQRDVERLVGEGVLSGRGPPLAIDCGAARRGARPGFPAEDYELEVGAEGVRLSARGPLGVLRGLATLRQLVRVSGPQASLAFVCIEDEPRFVWRGLMIDTARHFMPIAALKRQIDAMEQVKLGVLHLHLSDNEAFRVESRRFPRLHEVAARGRYYSQSDIRELVAYASDRGVAVAPEIDVPAHVGAILRAYPELRAAPVDPNDRYAALNGALDPSSEATYRFVEDLFGEMAALFPWRYFHLGGDEVEAGAWD